MASKRKADEISGKDVEKADEQEPQDKETLPEHKRIKAEKRNLQLKKFAYAISTDTCECGDECDGWQCHCEKKPCICAPASCLGKACAAKALTDDCEIIIVLKQKGGAEYTIKL